MFLATDNDFGSLIYMVLAVIGVIVTAISNRRKAQEEKARQEAARQRAAGGSSAAEAETEKSDATSPPPAPRPVIRRTPRPDHSPEPAAQAPVATPSSPPASRRPPPEPVVSLASIEARFRNPAHRMVVFSEILQPPTSERVARET
ncbi:MAG: hypothetical protein V1809_01740 [Planctomycetota bacterium]